VFFANEVHKPQERAFAVAFLTFLRAGSGRLLEVLVVLVHRVVSEVHADVGYVLLGGLYIFFGAHSHESILEEIHAKGTHGADETVQP
jgi:hypothetical protein